MLTVYLHYGSVNLHVGCAWRTPDPLHCDAGKRKHPSFGGAKDSDTRDPLTRAARRAILRARKRIFAPPTGAFDRKEPQW